MAAAIQVDNSNMAKILILSNRKVTESEVKAAQDEADASLQAGRLRDKINRANQCDILVRDL